MTTKVFDYLAPDAITYDELMEACEKSAPDVAKILAKERPRNGRGGDRKSKAAKANQNDARHVDMVNESYRRPKLASRLEQEHPEHYQAYLDGMYKSIRAAAEAAGLVFLFDSQSGTQ